MKKWLRSFLTMLLMLGAAAAGFADTGGYRKNCIEGTGCLDAIDGDHAYMLDGSHGYVIYNGMFYPYYLDDDSAAAESGVAIVAPTTNGGDKRWLLAYPGGFTASRALASDADGKAVASDVTADELGYVDGVTSAIQTQLNGKIAATGVTYENLDANGDVGTGATQVAAGNHSHSGYESSSSNDFDPDRLAGDTSDDNLIDAGIVAVLNQATTGSAGSVKSPATTGVVTITGPAAGTTRAKTVRDADDTLLELGGSYTPTGTWDWSSATISAGVVTSEVDGDTTNEINTITGDNATTTSGLAITIAGAGIASTAVAGDTLTVTATEVDGSTTNEVNTITADDANTTTGLAITVAGGGIAATTVAGDTVTVTATEVDSVVGAITGLPKADGAGNISAAVAGTDYAAADHDATHAVGGTDTVFPADPGADRYLMWDDDPGALVWSEVSAGGLFDSATGIATAADATLQKSDPQFIFQNTDEEDSDNGRQSVIAFKGEQSGGEVTTLATITASHSGTSDDQKGQIVFAVNDGNDGSTPTISMILEDNGNVTLPKDVNMSPGSVIYLKGTERYIVGSGEGLDLFSAAPVRALSTNDRSVGNFFIVDQYNSGYELTDTDNGQSIVYIGGESAQTLTAALDVLYVDHDITSLGDGSTGDGNNLLRLAVNGGTTKFKVDTSGNVTMKGSYMASTSHVTCSDVDDTCAYTSTAQQHWITGGTDATGDTMTVTAGTDGQTMTFTQVAGTDDTTIDVSTGTDSTLADAGDSVTYRYNGTTATWYIISSVGL